MKLAKQKLVSLRTPEGRRTVGEVPEGVPSPSERGQSLFKRINRIKAVDRFGKKLEAKINWLTERMA